MGTVLLFLHMLRLGLILIYYNNETVSFKYFFSLCSSVINGTAEIRVVLKAKFFFCFSNIKLGLPSEISHFVFIFVFSSISLSSLSVSVAVVRWHVQSVWVPRLPNAATAQRNSLRHNHWLLWQGQGRYCFRRCQILLSCDDIEWLIEC